MGTVRSGPSVPPVLSFQGRYFVNVEIVRRGPNRIVVALFFQHDKAEHAR
jgi:hypothetical protein